MSNLYAVEAKIKIPSNPWSSEVFEINRMQCSEYKDFATRA